MSSMKDDSIPTKKGSHDKQTPTAKDVGPQAKGVFDVSAALGDLEAAEEESAIPQERNRKEDGDDGDIANASPKVDTSDAQHEPEKTFVRKYGALVAIVLLVILLVVVVTATVTTQNTKEKKIVVRSLEPTPMPTMITKTNNPTISPTTFLESGRTFSPTSDRFIDVVEEVLRQFESPTLEADLLNPRSPQFRAALWMSEVDAHNATSDLSFPLSLNYSSWLGTKNEVVEFRQRYALVTFFYSTKGEEWVDKCKFLSPEVHVCDWQCPLPSGVADDAYLGAFLSNAYMGVTCGDELEFPSHATNVVSLQIGFNQLSGTIPDELQGLDLLRQLHLPGNSLSGTIPFDAIANNLVSKLNASDPILSSLVLSANLLEGPISSEALSKLALLDMVDIQNNLISGTVPTLQGMRLLGFMASGNLLSGSLPDTIFDTILLDLSWNSLTGTIPLFNLTISPMEGLYLAENSLSGSIPDSIRYLETLNSLSISDNAFTGTLPSGIGELQRLGQLLAYQNRFSGKLLEDDSFLYKLTNLELLAIGDNQFSGTISSQIKSLNNTVSINVGHSEYQENAFTGTLPTEIGFLTQMSSFLVSRNKLTGTIPTEVGLLSQNLEWLSLNGNDFTGTIPTELSLLTNLSTLTIQSNSQLTGSLEDFCSNASTELGLVGFVADCQEETVECNCCNTCCNFARECEAV